MKSIRLMPPDAYPAIELAKDVNWAINKMNSEGKAVYTSFALGGRFSISLRGEDYSVGFDLVTAGLKKWGWTEFNYNHLTTALAKELEAAIGN